MLANKLLIFNKINGMKRIYFLSITCMLYFNITFSQNSYEFEFSEGFVFFDYFGDEPVVYDKVFAGYGLQTEIDIWKNIFSSNAINLKLGIGYTNYYYLYDYGFTFIARDEISTSYLNLKFGLDYKPNWSKIDFFANFTNYILPYKEKQQYSQNRWFSNLDLGLSLKIINGFYISLWSPITLYPMHNGKFVDRPINLDFDPWVEITGLNLGISYEYGY